MRDRASRESQGTLGKARRAYTPNGHFHPFPKIAPLPGSLQAERKRCNRPNCRCTAGGDALHGPYLYRRWREDGRLRRRYVRAADAEYVRACLAAWRRLHPPARSMRATLAELRRRLRPLDPAGV